MAAILLLTLCVSHAFASQPDTWKRMHQFGKSIGCGFFFDKDHGLIGSGVRPGSYLDPRGLLRVVPGDTISIYKTTDGGVTWTESQTPIKLPGAVTSISMVDTLTGYASIFSTIEFDYFRTFGRSSIWKTTDGGYTWFDPFHFDHLASSIYAQNGLLVYTKWDLYYTNVWTYGLQNYLPALDTFGGAYSYDDGKTWSVNFRRGNGIAFSDSLNGVMTEMNAGYGGDNFWFTMDAGRSWQRTNIQYESWSIYAVPGKRIYFCANESQENIPHTSVNWSTDGGQTWSTRARFPRMQFTGTIAGVGSTLYFQTDTTFYPDTTSFFRGIYRSDNLGATWHWVAGPSNSRDTRFVVTGCSGEVVYAFDAFGGVWKTVDGGDGTMAGGNPNDASFVTNADTIRWIPNPCGDTISFTAFGTNCVPITIDSVSTIRTTEFLHLQSDRSLPQALSLNDSVRVSLVYVPTHGGPSVSVIRIYAHAGSRIITRDITIDLSNTLRSGIILSKDSSQLTVTGCGAVEDTIYLANLGCSGMVLDSVVVPAGEVTVSNQLPDSIPDNKTYPLQVIFAPDSAGIHTILVHLYAHTGRRQYDTVIAAIAQSIRAPLAFRLDSTALVFSTNYCKPQSALLHFGTTGCDSVKIDSVVSSNQSFQISGIPSGVAPRATDSLTVGFIPLLAGPTSGTVHIYGHSGTRLFDTVITLTAINYALPEGLTISRQAITLAATTCTPLHDTLSLTNQGCDLLYLDSVISSDSEVTVSYNSTLLPLRSNDSLVLTISFSPSDGNTKLLPLRMFLHTAKRTIDTVVSLNLSNAIPPSPLALSNDSLFLLTKYCQSVSLPFTITNSGCPVMTVDSAVIIDDLRHEFHIENLPKNISSQGTATGTVNFNPDSSGSRITAIKLYTHSGSQEVDTVIYVIGKNVTAPEPYLPILPSNYAGQILRIPIMLYPTTDSFSMKSYAFHLQFNTDLVTPYELDFTNTCSKQVVDSKLEFEPGNGVSVQVLLAEPISNTSALDLPLVYILDSLAVTKNTLTSVVLNSFVTDREPSLQLCSIPSQPFQLLYACADSLLGQFISSGAMTFELISVNPNPVISDRSWEVVYDVYSAKDAFAIVLYDARGNEVSRSDALPSSTGKHSITIPAPATNGDYFFVLRSKSGQRVWKTTVKR